MDVDDLIDAACAEPLTGWDWSRFGGRIDQEPPPWDERAMVRAHLHTARSLLDLGTGGGELLSELAPLPGDTVATEGYEPNRPIARARLEPLGVEVVDVTSDVLPLASDRFDLVVARHESFDAAEVARVLTPGGHLVTQQVGGRDLADLNDRFGRGDHTYADWSLERAVAEVERAGLTILTAEEALLRTTFRDVGAVVLFLRMTPWQVPGFSVDADRSTLHALHDHIDRHGGWVTASHRFVVEARLPS